MPLRILPPAATLSDLYQQQELTLAEIEAMTGVSRYRIRRALLKEGIPLRAAKPRKKKDTMSAKTIARELYHQGYSRSEIAQALQRDRSTIHKWTTQ